MRIFSAAVFAALMRFNDDDGWAIASHISMSGILALFPFLIFCTSLAAFFNLGSFPQEVVRLIFDSMPDAVAAPLAEQVRTVLTEPRGDILTFGAAVALFFASNGVEALRLGLNRAYRVASRRNFLMARLQSILFVVVAAIVAATIVFLLVLTPLVLDIARRHIPALQGHLSAIDNWRLLVSSSILTAALLASHLWLPNGRRGLRQVLPGVVFTVVCWVGAAIGFSIYLRSFADYVSTYAGMASVVVALIFFYLMGVIFILGAELNYAFQQRSERLKARAAEAEKQGGDQVLP